MLEALYFLQQSLNALQVSSFYALLAVAYVLIYGIANRINLAFGALAMWGGYLVIAGITMLFALTPLSLAVCALLAVPFALGVTATLGWVVQRGVIAPLLGRTSLAMLIATIGLATVLEETMRLTQGSRERWLQPFLDLPLVIAEAEGFVVQLTAMRVVILAVTASLALGLMVFVARHRFGRVWRACSQDPGMAALCGINVSGALAVSVVLASAYAGAAGVVIAFYYGNVSFYMGTVLGLKALLVAVVGGLNSLGGALVAALILGCLESFWSAYFAVEYRDVAVLGVMIGLMILRPKGLFSAAARVDQEGA